MTSYLFIVNPHARNKEVGKRWSNVEKEIKNRKMDYSVEFTTHPKHAIEIAKDQAKNFNCVIAAGGDGTSHEVANGIYGTDVSFGILALGNGNDYANLLKYSHDYQKCLDIVEKCQTVELNVGITKADVERYFINISELGFSSTIAKAIYEEAKWLKGWAKYYYVAMKKLAYYKLVPAKIQVDDTIEISTKILACGVGLGCTFGGGFKVLPGNKPYYDDFAVCVIGDIPKLKQFAMVNHVKRGTHIGKKGVHYLRGKNVKIEIERQLPVEAEGEVFSEKAMEITFSMAPKKLRVIVPKDFVAMMENKEPPSNNKF